MLTLTKKLSTFHLKRFKPFFVFLFLFLSIVLNANDDPPFTFKSDYEIRLNDKEAGFYYNEKIIESPEGPKLEMTFEIHDNKIGNRFGCEQTNRMIFQDMLEMEAFKDEGFENPNVSEEEFMQLYKSSFLQFADYVRPYADMQGFLASLEIWYSQNCWLRNRMEASPEWYKNLPENSLLLHENGLPAKKTITTDLYGQLKGTTTQINYNQNEVSFLIQNEQFSDISAAIKTTKTVFDPFQLNMIVSSLNYHEDFELDLLFKNIYVEYPLGESAVIGQALPTEIYPVEVKLQVTGTMFVPMDGDEIETWAVELSGFTGLYHPLLDIYDFHHRRFDKLRYFIDKASGNILQMESLTSGGRPVSIYFAE